MIDQNWVANRSFENLYVIQESSESGSSKPNPLVQLDPGLFIWTIITFLLLFFVLAKFAWKPILKVLNEREDQIKIALDDADKAKQELERLNQESEDILKKAHSDARIIHSDAKLASEKFKDEMISKAKEEEKKIIANAQNQIKVEKDLAIDEIRKKIVNLTLLTAEKIIKKNLSSKQNQEIIEESLKDLDKYSA